MLIFFNRAFSSFALDTDHTLTFFGRNFDSVGECNVIDIVQDFLAFYSLSDLHVGLIWMVLIGRVTVGWTIESWRHGSCPARAWSEEKTHVIRELIVRIRNALFAKWTVG